MANNNKSDDKNQAFPQAQLKEWFLKNRRPLPWRENPTPYRVWVSEIMLQQTQVSVVIPYFERWMEVFPKISDLAKAPIEFVLKMWEGLGYYSRARHLHAAAQMIVQKWSGDIPEDGELLSQIPGVGSYTKGAILSFAFKQKAAAVDGNVLRVLARFFAIEKEIDRSDVRREIETLATAILPDDDPWLITEGLIELGATVCGKKPLCPICPLSNTCIAWKRGVQEKLPLKCEKKKTTLLQRTVAVIHCEGSFLIKKGEKGKVMADLYEFPYDDMMKDTSSILERFERQLEISLVYQRPLKTQQHTFTRFKAYLFPHLFEAKNKNLTYLWMEKERLLEVPFSSGHRRILHEIIGKKHG